MLFKNRQIAILFAGLFVVMLGFGIIIPILPMYAKALGASAFHLGAIMATFSIFQFVFAPIWGTVSDRIGRKPVLMLGLVGYMGSHVVNGLANSVAMLFLARAIGGILSSAVLPTALAYISDVTGDRERGAGMGVMGAAMGAGTIFGPSLGGFAAHFTSSFRMPFFLAAGLVFLLIPLAWRFLPETHPEERRVAGKPVAPHDRVRELIAALRSELAVYFLAALLISFAAANMEGILGYYALDRFGCGAREMGIIFTIIGVVSVVMQGVLVGPSINRFGEDRLILASMLTTALGFVLLTRAWSFPSLTALVTFNMIGGAFLRPSISSIVSKRTPTGQGATMGVVGSFDSLGRIAGPLLAGWLYQYSMNLPYYVGAAVTMVGVGFVLPTVLRGRTSSEPAARG